MVECLAEASVCAKRNIHHRSLREIEKVGVVHYFVAGCVNLNGDCLG